MKSSVSVGILVLFLPPNSPDLNPIDETFSYGKHDTLVHFGILTEVAGDNREMKKTRQKDDVL